MRRGALRPPPPSPTPTHTALHAHAHAHAPLSADCKDRNQLFEKIKKGALEFPPYLSADARALLTALLERDPSRRLGCGPNDAADVKAHPFFRTVHWEALRAGRLPSPFVPPVLGSCDTSQFDTEFTSMPIVSPSSLKDGPAGASVAGKANFEGFTFVAPHAVGPGAGATAAAGGSGGGGGVGALGGGGDAGGSAMVGGWGFAGAAATLGGNGGGGGGGFGAAVGTVMGGGVGAGAATALFAQQQQQFFLQQQQQLYFQQQQAQQQAAFTQQAAFAQPPQPQQFGAQPQPVDDMS